MRRIWIGAVVLGLLSGCGRSREGAGPASASSSDPATIAWTTDYDRALADAKASGKPLFLYFTMDG